MITAGIRYLLATLVTESATPFGYRYPFLKREGRAGFLNQPILAFNYVKGYNRKVNVLCRYVIFSRN